MNGTDDLVAGAQEQAAAWYARLHAPGADVSADHAAWLAADPSHRAAWQRITHADAALDVAGQSDAIRAMLAEARAPRASNDLWRYAAAAAVVLAVGGTSMALLREERAAPAPEATTIVTTDYATAVGERRTIALADGSVMTLDTGSRARAELGGPERRIALESGQAFFKVAKDRAHPFIVSAGGNSVTALGTQFDVRVDPARFSVSLVEGTVRVDTPSTGRASILHPGGTLVAQGRDVSVTSTGAERAAEWMDGHLRFDAVPLSVAVAEMNRYYANKIVIADPALASEPVSGVFRTDGGSAFVTALQEAQIARVDGTDPNRIVLRRF